MTNAGQRRARKPMLRRLIGLLPGPLRQRRVLLLAPLVMIALLGLMKVRGGGATPDPVAFAPIVADQLQVLAPERIAAGDTLSVVVRGDLAAAAEVALLVETGYGQRRFTVASADGEALFQVEPVAGPTAGVMTLTALAGDQTGHAILEQVPGPAVDPLELFLGPRTIEATGGTATMLVVVAEDEYGNPVPDGTSVDVRITRPDLRAQALSLQTDGLLAWSRILSETLAGRSKVAVTVGDGRGQELDFLEVAGSPGPFEVAPIDPPVPADGRSLVRLRTSDLLDEFGNPLPDGLTVYADMAGTGGVRRLRSQVIKGQAQFTFEAPSRPGTESIIVQASGTFSTPLLLDFGPMVTEFDVAAGVDLDGLRLEVGPVISTLGAYVPDGTPVIVTSEFGEREHPTFNGVASIVVPETSEPILVTVLGFERTIRVGS